MELIKTKQSDPETEEIKKIVGTAIVILSGLILYLDKIFLEMGWMKQVPFQYYHSIDIFVWYVAQTVSPMMIIFAAFLGSKKWAYLCPLLSFTGQFIFLMNDEQYLHSDYFWYYTAIFIAFFFAFLYFTLQVIRKYAARLYQLKKSIRECVDFVVVTIKERYITEPQLTNYIKDYFKLLSKLNQWN